MNDKNLNKYLFIHQKHRINFINRPNFTNDAFLHMKNDFYFMLFL
jgi:hypothetical protein